jgi:ribulose-phosphate 3-epimerase
VNLKEKISACGSKAFIEMDGGIDSSNIEKISKAGVNVFVCGNAVFGAKDSAKALKELKEKISA